MEWKDVAVIVSIVSGITSVAAFILIALPQRKIYQVQATTQYFKDGDSPEAAADRRKIYRDGPLDEDAARRILYFFHRWGLAAKHGLLPLWVFDSASGLRILQLHDALEDFLVKERKRSPKYAEGFLYLVASIRWRHPGLVSLANLRPVRTAPKTAAVRRLPPSVALARRAQRR